VYSSRLLTANSTFPVIILPNDELYDLLAQRWSPNEEGKPQVIFQPVREADVGLAISYAVANDLDVAVANGGHSFLAASSTVGGVQIDMRRMRMAYVNNERFGADGILTIEGGAIVSDVAGACEKRGTYITLPSHKEIGYVGFTLGGGGGWGLGHQGLSIDLLLEARIALASGQVVTASENENPGLFWAVKGAGYNFGVVTGMKFKVKGLTTRVFSGCIVYPQTSYEDVFLAMEKYVAQQQEEDMVSFVLTPFLPGVPAPEALVAIPYYHGDDEQEARRRFKVFLDVPHIEAKVGLMWSHQTADLFPEALWPRTNRLSNGTVCTRLSPDIWLPVIDDLRKWWEVDPSRRAGTQFFLGLYNWRKTLTGGEPSSAWPPSRDPPDDAGNVGGSWRDFAVYIG